jgi:DNA polymerase III subunit delta'
MRFAEIPGLDELKKRLVASARRGTVAHAQLFSGYPGGAQLALALAYAAYLTCEQPGEEDSCGSCAGCQKNSRFVHPDLHFVFPVSAVREISGKDVVSDSFLREWREFLTANPYAGPAEWSEAFGGEDKQLNISREESRNIIRALSLSAFEARYKLMIVWLPEFLHSSAANALLKVLEEPSAGTVFLLVTSQQEQLLSTILSRTQIVKVRPFTDDEISAFLARQEGMPEEAIRQAVQIAGGDLNEALRLCREEAGESPIEFADWMRSCYTRDYSMLVEYGERFGGMKKSGQRSLLQYGLSMARESLAALHPAEGIQRVRNHELNFVRNFGATLGLEGIERVSREFNNALYHLERNANARIVFLDASLTISATLNRLQTA